MNILFDIINTLIQYVNANLYVVLWLSTIKFQDEPKTPNAQSILIFFHIYIVREREEKRRIAVLTYSTIGRRIADE